MRRRKFVYAAGVALLSGCLEGGFYGEGGEPAGAEDPGNSDESDVVETDTIRMPGQWSFDPEFIRVDTGTTVTWINESSYDHTVTFQDFDFDEVVAEGEEVEYTFYDAGEYDYECRFHLPDMTGRVVVEEPEETPEDGASDDGETGDVDPDDGDEAEGAEDEDDADIREDYPGEREDQDYADDTGDTDGADYESDFGDEGTEEHERADTELEGEGDEGESDDPPEDDGDDGGSYGGGFGGY